MKILQVNNIDLIGKVFNGYDISNYINTKTENNSKQIVIEKYSKSNFVEEFFPLKIGYEENYLLQKLEKNIFSIHSNFSLTSDILLNNNFYKEADIVHYHQIHNTQLNLYKLEMMSKSKPTVISVHDPWLTTGRCVHPGECKKWMTGCQNCEYLNTLFPFSIDNCSNMWKIKKKAYEEMDVDLIVSSKWMLNMIENSPLTKHFKTHLVPFGLDLSKFNFSISQEKAKKKLGIRKNSLVLFLRSQGELKGTEYVEAALKKLDVDCEITVLTCGQKGLLDTIKDKYKIIELGNILEEDVLTCFNACDIFLMPSKGESFGIMAIEAMASGKPVIIFDNTALPFVTFAPDCGLLVKNLDSNDLAEKIEYLINDKNERLRRGNLGRELANKHYDINEYHKKIEKIYYSAYDRQKYKINKIEKKNDKNIDYSNINVQMMIPKMKELYYKLFPMQKNDISFFKMQDYVKSSYTNRIDYSDENVQLLIQKFNEEIYQIISEKYNEYQRMIKSSKFYNFKIYRILRSNRFFVKVIRVIKKKRIKKSDLLKICDGLTENINYLEKKNKDLEKKVNYFIKIYSKGDNNEEKSKNIDNNTSL